MGGGTAETAAARAALDEAVSQFETPLLRYVAQLLGPGNMHEAEDVVQEAFLRYYREVSGNGAAIRNASTWLFRVAHNLAMDALRREARQNNVGRPPSADVGRASSPTDALDELMHRESCDKALAELHRLPEKQRTVLLLRVVHGMKLSEISEVTGLTPGNAGYRISQGLQELARRLKEAGVI